MPTTTFYRYPITNKVDEIILLQTTDTVQHSHSSIRADVAEYVTNADRECILWKNYSDSVITC